MAQRSAMVVATSPAEVATIREALPGWECAAARLSEDGEAIAFPIAGSPDVAVVFGVADPAKAAVLCRELRETPATSRMPILLAISRYQLSHGNAVRNLGNASFILAPFDDQELRGKIDDLMAGS